MSTAEIGDRTEVSSAAQGLRVALQRALDHAGDVRVLRVIRLGSSVRFDTEEGDGVTLLLDRTPPAATSADEPAEITFSLTASQARELANGRLPMAAAVVSGEVEGRGPVRRFLEVDPILQSLLRQLNDE